MSLLRVRVQLARTEHDHGDRVIVYACTPSARTDAFGHASSLWWVGARARSFIELREQAFQHAGLEASPAVALFDRATQQVIFG